MRLQQALIDRTAMALCWGPRSSRFVLFSPSNVRNMLTHAVLHRRRDSLQSPPSPVFLHASDCHLPGLLQHADCHSSRPRPHVPRDKVARDRHENFKWVSWSFGRAQPIQRLGAPGHNVRDGSGKFGIYRARDDQNNERAKAPRYAINTRMP